MATVPQNAPVSVGRTAECAIALFGLAIAVAIFCISLDLLTGGMLFGHGEAGDASPAPDIPRPRLAPEADSA